MTAAETDPESPLWRRPRPALDRSDVVMGAGLFVVSLLSWTLARSIPGAPQPAAWLSVLLMAVMTVPLVLRRRYPIAVGLVIAAAYVAFGELGLPEVAVSQVVLFLAVYVIGAWEQDRRRALWGRVVILAGMAAWLIIGFLRSAAEPGMDTGTGLLHPLLGYIGFTLLINAMYFTGAVWFGDHSWRAAQQMAIAAARTAELQTDRQRLARQAVTIERMRVARELHDAVAHHVALMGVQAAAARAVLPTDPARAGATLEQLEDSARGAVAELYALLGTLRDDESPADHPAPVGLDQLPDLVENAVSAGLSVDLKEIGAPRPVPPAVSLTLYRVAQEALTNVIKHAGPGAHAQVRVRWLDRAVELEVSDDGVGRPLAQKRSGMGHLNMKERVAALKGQLEHGPRVGSGYLVRARFEVTG